MSNRIGKGRGTFQLLLISILLLFSQTALAQKSGAFYLGDSDGNGIIEIPDLSALSGILGNPGQPDPAVYSGHPQSRFRQELDGNGLIEVPDYSILLNWVTGNFSNRPGNPETLVLDSATYYLETGATVTLSAYAISPAAAGGAFRTGFGVVFKIDASSTCPTAQLYGYDVAGGETFNDWRYDQAYHYTLKPDAPEKGRTKIEINTKGCKVGDTIFVQVYIPDDIESGSVPGRFPDKLGASQMITVHVIDIVTPVTYIDSTPTDPSNDPDPIFTFSCDSPPCTFECSLDLAGWSSCDSPTQYFGLSSAGHFFEVRATDRHGHVDPLPPSYTWTIDTVPPETSITSSPPDPSNSSNADFTFICDEPPCTFDCSLDFGDYTPCNSGAVSYSGLGDGVHYFQVRATNSLGNPDPTPAGYGWEIDTRSPVTTILTYPPDPSNNPDPSFDFLCDESFCTYECQLDLGDWLVCSPPENYTGLVDGYHSFSVRATDLAGNPEIDPPIYNWRIDLTPPDTYFTQTPPDPDNATAGTFSFDSHEALCSFECKFEDSPDWMSCATTQTYIDYGEGEHWFTARAIDAAGNIDPNPALYYWNIKPDSWLPITLSGAPSGRARHSAVWTGSEMIVWGGTRMGAALADGARYNPSTDSWSPVSDTGAPISRANHTAVWTGVVMVVWGGSSGGSYLNSGARYNPATNTWTATTLTDAPAGRTYYSAIWTGTEMVVWGGRVSDSSPYFTNTGGKYDPIADTWTATSTTNAPSIRMEHTAVWSGNYMIIWGGSASPLLFNTGGRYDPSIDSWSATSTVDAPSERTRHAAVWTGAEMIVWGGMYNGGDTNSGAKYSPVTDSWVATTLTNAPVGRHSHTAVWTGSEMIVWGGFDDSPNYYANGSRYNPASDQWTLVTSINEPYPRYGHSSIWTGTRMVVWGGYGSGGTLFADGGRYNPFYNWASTNTEGAPSSRYAQSVIWTGSEMIVWGGHDGSFTNTGGKYNPATDSWNATSTVNAPSARSSHTAVWTGSVMIIWGGIWGDVTGGKYNPATNSWTATSTTDAPEGRTWHSAVWSNSEMIVWGGFFNDGSPHLLNTGGKYNPVSDAWTPTTTTDAPAARYRHTGVWAGSEMIVWGGVDSGNSGVNNGGKYNPDTDSWLPTSLTGAPTGRYTHSAVWTSMEMIVWGGVTGYHLDTKTGGLYDPSSDLWNPTATDNAPLARARHEAVWTGQKMIVWGGEFYNGADYESLQTGGKYDPSTNSWRATSTSNAPAKRVWHNVIWTGSEMIVWGGWSGSLDNSGGRYLDSVSWLKVSTIGAPSDRESHTAVWTGAEMIVWGGSSGSTYLNTGGRYNPATDSWTATTTTGAPSARAFHTAAWTGTKMIVWGGMNISSSFNTGSRYDPAIDSWADTTISDAPSSRFLHSAVWTGTEMIVWGGWNWSSLLLTGGRYDPATDAWIATSLTDAPEARYFHTAVWTGSEMIVWGGATNNYPPDANTGGRYDPATDSWTSTNTTNAPSERSKHTAIWTGTDMVVWGGWNFSSRLLTGGRYNPATDAWTATNIVNAPTERIQHTAVWTGVEMIIWGGEEGAQRLNTGGKYSPATDSWTNTDATSAPQARMYHSAVWTGSQMIIWGGKDGGNYTYIGGRYVP